MSEARPLLAAMAVLIAAAALAAGRPLAGGGELDADRLAAAGMLASIAFAALAIAGGLMMRKPLTQSLGLVRARAGAPAPGLLLVGLLGFGVAVRVALGWSGWFESSALEEVDRAMRSVRTAPPQSRALLGVGVALAPGIAEELLFRGLLLGILLERWGVVPALVLSTVPFAGLHLDATHIAGAAALGLYLASVRIVTGSTVGCIACHVANNALAIFLSTQSWPAWSDWILIPLCLGAALMGWAAMWRSGRAPMARDAVAE